MVHQRLVVSSAVFAILAALWLVFALSGGARQHPLALTSAILGLLVATWSMVVIAGQGSVQRFLASVLFVIAAAGAAAFLGFGGWKVFGSVAQESFTIPRPVSQIQTANLGLGVVDVRRVPGSELRLVCTLRYLTPLVHRPRPTYRLEDTVLSLHGGPFLSAVDYVIEIPERVRVSGDIARGGLHLMWPKASTPDAPNDTTLP